MTAVAETPFGQNHPETRVRAAVRALRTGRPVLLTGTGGLNATLVAAVGADRGRSWDLLTEVGDGTLQVVGRGTGTAASVLVDLTGLHTVVATTEVADIEANTSAALEMRSRAVALSLTDLIGYLPSELVDFEIAGPVRLPTRFGDLHARCYRFADDVEEHLVLTDISGPATDSAPLVAIHRECELGDIFGTVRCNCRIALDAGLVRAATGGGVVIYLRRSEIEASAVAARIATVLGDLGLRQVRLTAGTSDLDAAESAVPAGVTDTGRIESVLARLPEPHPV